MIKIVGHRLLIQPDVVEEVTKSGIVLVKKSVDLEQTAQERGTVLQIGPQCWDEFGDGTPWCKVGDKVFYPKYSGMRLREHMDDEKFLIALNDEDIVGVIIEDEEVTETNE